MDQFFSTMWEYVFGHRWQIVGLLDVAIDVWATTHVVLYKRDARSAVAWVGLIWLVPLVGPVLYLFLGVNRIQRRARALRRGLVGARSRSSAIRPSSTLARTLTPEGGHLGSLVRLVTQVTRRPLLRGNQVRPLVNGDEAYPAMLHAIDAASDSVCLSTYILDNDRVGKQFLEALRRAVARGVEARVLIDDVGTRYSWPSLVRPLRRAGVNVARFLPTHLPWSFAYANLRDHRKILVIDGRVGFTGGMNVRQGHSLALRPPHPIQDLHFQITGPAVAHLQETFAEDWEFCTGESLQGARWYPQIPRDGPVLARGISSGPDDDFEKIRMVYLGGLACAQTSVRVVTPYFLPDAALVAALSTAALRGVRVDILLPRKNNLWLVQWASRAGLWQVLEHGCRVWETAPPFDHTKLVLVDDAWALFGSANWDPRSLRLNFEFDLECYDQDLVAALENVVQGKLQQARLVSLGDVDSRALPVKLRDGVARLLSPYL
jgi:cardiolipin synthase